MDKKILNYLRGFSFERSFNKRVLSDDTEMHEAYKKAQEEGKLPFNRTKVLIIGDHAAGKTSTCRRLQGKGFRHDEPSTSGIEKKTVNANISNVNSKWCEVTNTPLEDYESSAAWWAVSYMRKNSKNNTTGKPCIGTGRQPNKHLQGLVRQLFEDTVYQMLYIIPIVITFLFGGFTFGFGLVVWIYIICLILLCDVHSAYRFGSGFAIILVFIDSAVNINYVDLKGVEQELLSFLVYGSISLLAGILISSGGRTGICISFCIMAHPKQKLFTTKHIVDTFIIFFNTLYFELIIFVLTSVSFVIFRNVHKKILSLSKRIQITVLLGFLIFVSVSIFIARSTFLRIYIFTSLSIVVIVTSNVIGLILGRKIEAFGHIPQNYVVKKFSGFVTGIFIAVICGWNFSDLNMFNIADNHKLSTLEYLFNQFLLIAPITGFIIYEWFGYMKVKKTINKIKHIRKSMEATIRNESYLDVRLSLWDFAGQEIYYNTHHLFMPSHGVYLILFNAVEAIKNPAKHIKRLQFWLQSVAMHAEIGNVIVFLVGTRRESVTNIAAFSNFDNIVKAHLYRQFSKLLTFHPSGNLCFFIENLLQIDKERIILREVIYNEVKQLTFFQETFLVKYLLFKETLSTFCREKCIITSLQNILEEVKSTCNIISQKELCKFLNFFDKSGDIIYKEHDEFLCNYVVCDPQVLIDILKVLVNVPELHKRNRTVADFWQRLQDTGIVDSRLLEHICQIYGNWRLYPYVIRFLVGAHLIFPLHVIDIVDQVGTFCLPCRLSNINMMSEIWNSNDHLQEVYFFDFSEILPEFIFLRLLAKCCEAFTWDKIYYNAARFRATNSCLFLINTQVISGSEYDRNLIKLSVHNEEYIQSNIVLQKIITFIEEIINKHFNPDYFREQYTCGPECKRCSLLDEALCVVNLIAHGKDISTLNGYRPDHFHKVLLDKKISFTCNRLMSRWV